MAAPVADVVADYRRRPLAALAAAATLLVPAAFGVLVPVVTGFGQLLIPFGILALALVAQLSRLATAPATVVAEALLDDSSRREVLATARRRAPDRVVAAAVERLVVVPATILVGGAVLLVALALATAGGAALSAAGVRAPQSPYLVLTVGVFGLLSVGAAVGAVFRLGTVADDVPADRRPGVALTHARRDPRGVAWCVAARTAPWLAFLLVFVLGLVVEVPDPGPTAALGMALVVAVVSTVVGVGLERRVAVDSDPQPTPLPTLLPSRRVIVVAVVLVAAVSAPAVAVRVDDVRPSSATTTPVSEDATAAEIVAGANGALPTTDHVADVDRSVYDDSTGRMEPALSFDVRWNPSDRQYRVVADGPGTENSLLGDNYYADGTFALENRQLGKGGIRSVFVRDEGNWSVVAIPFASVGGVEVGTVGGVIASDGVDPGALEWRVLERRDGAVVVGVTSPDRLAPAFDLPAANVSADSHVRLVVDADTGRPDRLDLHRNVTVDGERRQRRVVVDYRGWDTYDVQRPDAIGGQGPIELFWDALGY